MKVRRKGKTRDIYKKFMSRRRRNKGPSKLFMSIDVPGRTEQLDCIITQTELAP